LSEVGGGIGESRADEAKVGIISINITIGYNTTSSNRPNIPIGVVDLGICAEKLLLARLIGVVPTDLVTVLLSLEERSDVVTGPHLLTGELAIKSN
jgi:hypothetical protein